MKISKLLLNEKPTLSFEVFPPKTESSFDSVLNATKQIAELKPSFMSVTYGAGGGTSKYTSDIANIIQKTYDVPTLAHLTCVSSSKKDVKEHIQSLGKRGIENIMALRGDLTPELEGKDRSNWDYRHASELIRDIKESGYDFCIGGACYPEKHPESLTKDEDLSHLKEKVDAGVDFLTTQMFFDNDLFFNFLYKAAGKCINVPFVAGIMPITTGKQFERAVKISGSFVPQKFINLVDKYGDDALAMKQAGIAYATEQIVDLLANGIRNIHVYSMNKPEIAKAIYENVKDIVKI